MPNIGSRRLLRLWMVDDHAAFREGLALLLNTKLGFRVTRQFDSIEPLLSALAEERPPDLVLLDLNIGKENGLSAIQPIGKLAPSVKVLMLTTFTNTYSEAEAFRLGASGFLLKIYELDEIVELIRQAFHEPDDPRLFPNVSSGRFQGGPPAGKAAPSMAIERPGFLGALRQLCRVRRQTAD
jgi:DNA-binding NarL/FixJ family response regulator